jgi:diguanylate cyclase (GGDEF)-like protein
MRCLAMATPHSRAHAQRELDERHSLSPSSADNSHVTSAGFYRIKAPGSAARTLLAGVWGRIASRTWAHNLWFALPVCHWLVQSEFALLLLTMSPLLLIVFQRGTASGYVYAGLCSVLLSGADLIHPLHGADSLAWGAAQRVVSLAIMAFVLARLHHAYSALEKLSQHDPLTGVLNRRGFDELAKREMVRAERYKRPIAFALVDIDRFKEVNDRFGHARGDRVLGIVGAELAHLRGSDVAVRLGGDEFGLLMPETDEVAAASVLDRLKLRVEQRTRAEGLPITISVGTVASEPAAQPIASLIAEADRRMYAEKLSSRKLRTAVRAPWEEAGLEIVSAGLRDSR